MKRSSTTSAVFWSGADALLRQGAYFASSVVLARLLKPEAFGAIATLQVFMGIAAVLVGSGLSASLIRTPESTRAEESSVFYFNLVVAALLASLIAICAPWIAAFFRDPILEGLTYLMALNLFLSAFSTIHTTLLDRALAFRTLAKVALAANIISSGIGIILAYRGWGAWSLAIQALVSTSITGLLLWYVHRWRPTAHWDLGALRKHLGFGSYLLAAKLLDVAALHLNTVLIARLFSTRDLAFYSRASGTQQMPVGMMTSVISRVTYPIFATATQDTERLVNLMRRGQRTIMWLTVPAMFGMMVLAEPLVHTFFGATWLPSVPILQVLALVGLALPLRIFNGDMLLALGQSKLMFRMEFLKKGVGITLTVLASFHGVVAMAWAQVATAWLVFFINAYCTGRIIKYGALAQLKDVLVYWALAVPMAALLWALRPLISPIAWVQLAVLPCLGAALYLGASQLLGLQAGQELMARLQRKGSPSSGSAREEARDQV